MNPEINLLTFCDPKRASIAKPFTWGEYTYATNGKVLIRVAARADVPVNFTSPPEDAITQLLAAPSAQRDIQAFQPVPQPQDWIIKSAGCDMCSGIGSTQLVCPHCGEPVECPHCGVLIGGVLFRREYLRQLVTLPDAEIAVSSSFAGIRFNGGVGVICPLATH
jgi:hypothetical protein